MREFKVSCIDQVSGYEMVLSECSYNKACMYLQNKYHPQKVRTETDYKYTYIILCDVGLGKEFVYDEQRGYLMAR